VSKNIWIDRTRTNCDQVWCTKGSCYGFSSLRMKNNK